MTTTAMILIPILGGIFAGIFALFAVLWLAPRQTRSLATGLSSDILSEPRQFRFRNGYLTEHSDDVGFLLPVPINSLTAQDDLLDALSDLNGDVPAAYRDLSEKGKSFRLEGLFGSDRVLILGRQEGSDILLSVATADASQSSIRIDQAGLAAMEAERATLERANASSSTLCWATDETGQVIWANSAYIDLLGACFGPDARTGWPLQTLFADSDGTATEKSRRKCRDRDGQEHWFDVTLCPPAADGVRHGHAISLDAVIKAEETLRTFIQTLTKSFSSLPTGLAIFDRDGHLTLFNPALLDMTGLDGGWLSRRPRLSDVMDALRDRKKLPEPRDYKRWRDGLTVPPGRHDEPTARQAQVQTWTLPSGNVHRMTTHPQGDGSIMLMLEDVSADAIAERRSRQDREMVANLLGAEAEGYVIFDADAQCIVANAAACALWATSAEPLVLPQSLPGCVAFWKAVHRPNTVWGELLEFAQNPGAEPAPWAAELVTLDGTAINMRILPQPGNRLALSFQAVVAMATPRKDARSDTPEQHVLSA